MDLSKLNTAILRYGATWIPTALLVLSLYAVTYDPVGALTNMRNIVFDYFQKIQPREYVDTKQSEWGVGVRFLDIDDKSLELLGQWPWPRQMIAHMLERAFIEGGAAAVTFDMVFAEPDRTSPSQFLELMPDDPEFDAAKLALMQMPDFDDILAEMLGQAPITTGFVLTAEENDKKPFRRAGVSHLGDDPVPFLAEKPGAVVNLPAFERNAMGNGSFTATPDADGIIRRTPMVLAHDGQIYPSLTMETLRVVQGASTFLIKSSGASGEQSYGESTGLVSVRVGNIQVPTSGDGNIWVHYTSQEEAKNRVIPVWQLFTEEIDRNLFENNILFVGTSAAGLKDLRATPLNQAAPGVEVHLNAIEQVLLGHYLQRPDWALGAEVIFMLAVGVLLILLLPRLSAVWCAVVALTAIIGAFVGVWFGYTEYLVLIDPILPTTTLALIFMSGSFINFLKTEAERSQVRGAFSQYLSPDLVEQLAENPDMLTLGGETKEMTFLFCDIRGFTPISEQYKSDPQGLTKLINRFLTPMTNLIMGNQGTIDKYMGDCIMAFWNAPLDVENHPYEACQTSLQMIEDLKTLNAEREQEAAEQGMKFLPINIGIGVNTGDCVVGNMGSEQRFDYSVLGDAVNTASRLEGQSKTYGATIVIGEDTYKSVEGQFATLELDLIAVKGKDEALRIYTLLGGPDDMGDDYQSLRKVHDEMIAHYFAQEWDEAKACLDQCRKSPLALQGLYDLYEERLDAFRQDPPGEGWDGVFRATSK